MKQNERGSSEKEKWWAKMKKKKTLWCSWSMCFVLLVMYSSIKWMRDHLILYENFCSSSEFHSLCYFSACAISLCSHRAHFFATQLQSFLLADIFFSPCPYVFHFSFVHCWTTVVVVLFIKFHRVLFIFHYYFALRSRACFKKKKNKNDWGLCSAVLFPVA